MPSFKISADIFTGLEIGESNTERRVKISGFRKKAPDNIFIIKSQNLVRGA